jgi:hypothetical protein
MVRTDGTTVCTSSFGTSHGNTHHDLRANKQQCILIHVKAMPGHHHINNKRGCKRVSVVCELM